MCPVNLVAFTSRVKDDLSCIVLSIVNVNVFM
jgi:hypothetical protein